MKSITSSIARACAAVSAVALLAIAPCHAQQPDSTNGTGSVLGRVVDSASHAVVGALVSIDSVPRTVATNDSGSFRLDSVPVGEHLLWIRQIGFQPEAFHIGVQRHSAKAVLVRVTSAAVTLPAVKTEVVGQWGKPERLDYTTKYDEFYRRRAEAVSGRFLTHEDVEAMKTSDLTDILNRVPFLKLDERGDGASLSMPGCSAGNILIMIDDQRVWPGPQLTRESMGTVAAVAARGDKTGLLSPDALGLLKSLHDENIEGIEVYNHLASLPFEAADGSFCAEIRIWTR